MDVITDKNLSPKLGLTTLNQITGLLLEHRVLVSDGNQLIVAEALSIGDVREVRVASLAELANNEWLVQLHREG